MLQEFASRPPFAAAEAAEEEHGRPELSPPHPLTLAEPDGTVIRYFIKSNKGPTQLGPGPS